MSRQIKYKTEHQKKLAVAKQQNEYHKRATTSIALRFHNEIDKDILDKLASVENKTGYLKDLIRKDLKGE